MHIKEQERKQNIHVLYVCALHLFSPCIHSQSRRRRGKIFKEKYNIRMCAITMNRVKMFVQMWCFMKRKEKAGWKNEILSVWSRCKCMCVVCIYTLYMNDKIDAMQRWQRTRKRENYEKNIWLMYCKLM